jgi:hypothetical protein
MAPSRHRRHSSSRLTLDLYAQSVAARDRDAADALGATFMPGHVDDA